MKDKNSFITEHDLALLLGVSTWSVKRWERTRAYREECFPARMASRPTRFRTRELPKSIRLHMWQVRLLLDRFRQNMPEVENMSALKKSQSGV